MGPFDVNSSLSYSKNPIVPALFSPVLRSVLWAVSALLNLPPSLLLILILRILKVLRRRVTQEVEGAFQGWAVKLLVSVLFVLAQ